MESFYFVDRSVSIMNLTTYIRVSIRVEVYDPDQGDTYRYELLQQTGIGNYYVRK